MQKNAKKRALRKKIPIFSLKSQNLQKFLKILTKYYRKKCLKQRTSETSPISIKISQNL